MRNYVTPTDKGSRYKLELWSRVCLMKLLVGQPAQKFTGLFTISFSWSEEPTGVPGLMYEPILSQTNRVHILSTQYLLHKC